MEIRTASDYYAQLVALLPPGPAWDVELLPELRDVLLGTAQELAREDLRLSDLFNEMFPDTVRELVPDWERVMELPDACLGENPAFEDRQLAVRRRLVEVGGQSRAFFIQLSIGQGYPEASITERRAPRFAARVLVVRTSVRGQRNSCGRSTLARAAAWVGALAPVFGVSASG